MVRIGVISDTHGEERLIRQAMEVFKELGVGRILHCGDLCVPDNVALFKEIPIDFVYGNCDSCVRLSIERAVETHGGTLHGDFGSLRLAGKNIAFLHGQNRTRLLQELDSGKWDLICCGHTHRYEFSMYGETILLNPGALRRRSETPGAVCVDLPKIDVTRFTLQ